MAITHRRNDLPYPVFGPGGRLIQPGCFMTDEPSHWVPDAPDAEEPVPVPVKKGKTAQA